MVSVKFFAQDKQTKEKTESSFFYFDELNFLVTEMIEANRKTLQAAMPTARVFALIEIEEEKK